MSEFSEVNNLELLVFYLTNAQTPSLSFLEEVRLINKENKIFKILDIQIRSKNPLLTLLDESGAEKLYSAENLKPPYWLSCDVTQETLKLMNDFRLSYLANKQSLLDELKVKAEILFREKVEKALLKHKKILEDKSRDFKGVSILERKYFSNCYECKEPVSNKSNYMCNACHSLICNKCGNCKCLYVDLRN